MNSKIVKSAVLTVTLGLLVFAADAQRNGRRRNPPATNEPAASKPVEQQNNNTNLPSGYNPYGNIPIVVDSTGLVDTAFKKSLRQDAAYDKTGVTERNPLPYENLRWDDALYTERVWREIDLREKMNRPFLYEAEDDNGSQIFVNILLKAVRSGEITAFDDDRFTTPLSIDQINQLTAGLADTVPVTDPNDINKIIEYRVTRASFDPKSVMRIALKEDWVFDREASRMFVRILGISPLKAKYLPNGQIQGFSDMFWVYYPDLRPILAKYEVYNPKNMGLGRMTWEELFETRMFSSYITKSTIDNPGNKVIRAYIKDPILALIEGDNIKNKIFDYEQNLWAY